jgi:protein dpy-30
MADKVEAVPPAGSAGETEKSKSSNGDGVGKTAEPMEVPVKENIDPTSEFPGEEGPSGQGDGKAKAGGNVAEGLGTSLSAQVQKIVGKELDPPTTKKARVDLQSMPTRQYLDQTVVPILLQGLAAVSKERPPEPIEYLAAFLLKNKNKFDV